MNKWVEWQWGMEDHSEKEEQLTSLHNDSGTYILDVAEHFCPLYSNAPRMLQLTTVSVTEGTGTLKVALRT